MAARKVSQTSENVKGLRRAVAEAVNPTMKRLGARALERGFSQEGLAKALNERYRVRLNGANVYAHITAQRPQRMTIERYANLLDLNLEQLHIIEHGSLPPDREHGWAGAILSTLSAYAGDFVPGTANAVRAALDDPKLRARVLANVAMAGHFPERDKRWLPRSVDPMIDVLAEALYPHLDLRKHLRARSPGDDALFPIWHSARTLYRDDSKAFAFVDACAAILRLDGIDTAPMHDYLRDFLSGRNVYDAAENRRKKGSRA